MPQKLYALYLKLQINYTLIAEYCNTWRAYMDIHETWSSVLSIIDYFILSQDAMIPVSRPGSFNDPDMVSQYEKASY